MLDNKSLVVLAYLKNHFATSDELISAQQISIDGLSYSDINKCLEKLEAEGRISVNHKYVTKPVESVKL